MIKGLAEIFKCLFLGGRLCRFYPLCHEFLLLLGFETKKNFWQFRGTGYDCGSITS